MKKKINEKRNIYFKSIYLILDLKKIKKNIN